MRVIMAAVISTPLALVLALVGWVKYPIQLEQVLLWNKAMVYAFWDWVIVQVDPGPHTAAQLRIAREGFGGSAYAVFVTEVQIVTALLVILLSLVFTSWRQVFVTVLLGVVALAVYVHFFGGGLYLNVK
jgi:hypothetical protein